MIQLQVLNKVLMDQDMSVIDENGLGLKHFTEYTEEFKFISEHYSRYGNTPDVESVLEQFSGFSVLNVRESHLYLVEKLREEYLYNSMVPILNKAAEEMQVDSTVAVSNLLPKVQELLEANQFIGGVNIAKHADKRLEWVESIKNKEGELLGIPTGFDLLDDVLSGMLPGEDLIAIVARPGEGKSWTIDKMIGNAWQLGHDVLLYSGEMSENQVGSRIDTLISNISINSITKGIWNDNTFEQYKDHIQLMTESKAALNVVTPYMLGGRNMTVPLLESMIRKFKPAVVGVDQLSLVDDTIGPREQKRVQYANITAELYKLSAKYKIPIILNVQAGRSSKDSASGIQLEHIAESDGVGQNASRVIAIKQEADSFQLSVVKNRYGDDKKTIEYMWDVDTGTYTLIGYKDEEDEEEGYHSRSERPGKGNVSQENSLQRKSRRASREIQRKVSREGIEAF